MAIPVSLRNMSAAARECGLTLNEVRYLVQDREIPVYRDGRTNQVYVDADGFEKVKGQAVEFLQRQKRYYLAPIHPAFGGQTDGTVA